jgi:hypothetical protein
VKRNKNGPGAYVDVMSDEDSSDDELPKPSKAKKAKVKGKGKGKVGDLSDDDSDNDSSDSDSWKSGETEESDLEDSSQMGDDRYEFPKLAPQKNQLRRTLIVH